MLTQNINISVPDKIITKVLPDDYIIATDEGEAISIACGIWFARGEPANVYISADGFMNTLNAITSFVIPERVGINIFISIGRTEPQHKVATELTPKIVEELKKYDTARIHYKFIEK